MRIYIHDKCLEQVFNLPKAIQKKVLDFQKKFRENPKAASIHLEPIQQFTDQQFRTARIDQKYRAIIRVPESGDDYYMLWVDNHDEAMDWATNKSFQWNERTNSAQIFEAPTILPAATTHAEPVENGFYALYTDEQLLAIGLPEIFLPIVRSIKDLDGLEKIEKNLPVDAFENLFYIADGASIQQLIHDIQEGKAAAQESINNRRSFVAADDKLLEEFLNGDLFKWQIFLHPTQRKLVEASNNGPVKVTGGGGTGKTVVAMHRLKFLLEQTNDKRPILFTTYTKALTRNLKGILQKMLPNGANYKLENIDHLAATMAKECGIIDENIRVLDFPGSKNAKDIWEHITDENLTGFDVDFLHQEYQHVWLYHGVTNGEQYFKTSRLGRGKPLTKKQKIEFVDLVSKYEAYKQKHQWADRAEIFNKLSRHFSSSIEKPFCHLIADEIQDMSNIELRFLRAITDEKSDDLFLVGDPYQNIYARKINFSKAGIQVRGNRSKRLRINYRTTEEIKRLAISTIRNITYEDFDGQAEKMDGYLSLFHGEKPSYQVFKTHQDEFQFIIRHIKLLSESGIAFNDMVIGCRLKDSIRMIKSALHNEKLNFFDLLDETGDKKGIHLSTLNSLKGLEYKVVFLADVNKQTAPLEVPGFSEMDDEQKNAHLNSERSMLYVAITRAISHLFITGTGLKSDLIGI
jgi:mRNA-degrading endonuclease RelE of RelBE toxin-antitoxin system